MPHEPRQIRQDSTILASGEPVAEYRRMSDEHQRYSIENQTRAIRAHAAAHNMVIVRSYADYGKSGLTLGGRAGLQELLSDVEQRKTDYSAVLVYDVSRWGRFQDPDESAYYEFICKRNGIRIIYCAEQFENDASFMGIVSKNLKRAMAAEWSRELSTKVFVGKCHLIELGFRQGGPPGVGLRRMMIDEQGNHKGELFRGQQKNLTTDRVILVPGPQVERNLILRIYDQYLNQGQTKSAIARLLNQEIDPTGSGIVWSQARVHDALTNEKYIGNNVSNRTSIKLKAKQVNNPPEHWVRRNLAFEPIVSADLFSQVKLEQARRRTKLTDEQLIEGLKRLLNTHGLLNTRVIFQDPTLPHPGTISVRFGGLIRAYAKAGYCPIYHLAYGEIGWGLKALHPEVMDGLVLGFQRAGACVSRNEALGQASINDEISIGLFFAKCKRAKNGRRRWLLQIRTKQICDINVIARMSTDNRSIRDYYVIPKIDVKALPRWLMESNGLAVDGYRCDDLTELYELGQRTPLPEVV